MIFTNYLLAYKLCHSCSHSHSNIFNCLLITAKQFQVILATFHSKVQRHHSRCMGTCRVNGHKWLSILSKTPNSRGVLSQSLIPLGEFSLLCSKGKILRPSFKNKYTISPFMKGFCNSWENYMFKRPAFLNRPPSDFLQCLTL